mmetsp:Transcript_17855/g.58695  ORF Transcript_17855/g.58695 Transcript_17855/m.58695 type:complete len:224 (-) Transcript_17855:652-1323(-)
MHLDHVLLAHHVLDPRGCSVEGEGLVLHGRLVGPEQLEGFCSCTANELHPVVVEDVDQSYEPPDLRQSLHAQHRDVVDDDGVEGASEGEEVGCSCGERAELTELEGGDSCSRQLDLDLPPLRDQRHRPERVAVGELGEPAVEVQLSLPDPILLLLSHDVGLERRGHEQTEVDVGIHVEHLAALLDGGDAGEEQVALDAVAVEVVRRSVRCCDHYDPLVPHAVK